MDYIYKYSYSGEIHDKSKIKDIELILFNNNIPYKIEKNDMGVKVYVALIHEELGRDIVENLNNDNLIYKKVIDYDSEYNVRKRRVIKKFEYRRVMMILFLLIFILLFMRSLILLDIMN